MKFFSTVIASALLLFGIGACAGVEQKAPAGDIAKKIAAAYGIQSFDQISTIRYEFNADLDGKQVNRKWIWKPKTDEVIYRGISSQLYPARYLRKDLNQKSPARVKTIDQWFVNDQYWLLLPFFLAWDSNADIQVSGQRFLPIGMGRALQLVVTFPAPGKDASDDVYELYVDENFIIKQWRLRPGEKAESTRVSTWEDNREVGPITVSMQRNGKDGKPRVWFSHVAVQLEGSEEWIEQSLEK